MASKETIDTRDGSRPPVRPKAGDQEDDSELLKTAQLVLLAHERCVNMSVQGQVDPGLSTAVEPNAYAEARGKREDALRRLMETRARGRRGLSAKKIVLAILVAWLGSEDPNCAHAMNLLDEYDRVISDGKYGMDPALAALTANSINRSANSRSQQLYETEDCGAYR